MKYLVFIMRKILLHLNYSIRVNVYSVIQFQTIKVSILVKIIINSVFHTEEHFLQNMKLGNLLLL